MYADSGPHQRWSVGGLFDDITINGNDLNVENRGNLGTGHGWTGAYMTVWNCEASTFHVRNPPTARNWLVGSIGTIAATSNYPVGADPAGTYDSSGPSGTGKAVYPRSLYYGQLQQRMKWPGSEFREEWLSDVDLLASTTFGDAVNCDATWLAQVEALDALPAFAKFDYLAGSRYIACTLDSPLDPGDTVVAASLTVSLRAVGSAASDNIWLDSTSTPQSFASLGWTPISTTAQTVRTMEVSPSLLADGRLNVALGTNCAVDFVVLHLQVQKAQPATGSTLNVGSAWTGAFVPVDPDTATWNSTSLAGTMTLGANLSWAGLIVNDPAAPLTFNATQTLTLGSGGIDMSAATVNLTLNHPLILGQNQPWNIGAGRTLTANGQISGAWDLTKTGPGSLILSAADTYTGTTDIDQGTLVFTANNSLDGGLTFGANGGSTNTGTLDLTSANATFGNLRVQTNTTGNNTINIGSGKTLTLTGSAVNNVISVGSSGSAKLQITGATGTLTVNDATRDIVVATTSPGPATTQSLDLSELSTFNATLANHLDDHRQ